MIKQNSHHKYILYPFHLRLLCIRLYTYLIKLTIKSIILLISKLKLFYWVIHPFNRINFGVCHLNHYRTSLQYPYL